MKLTEDPVDGSALARNSCSAPRSFTRRCLNALLTLVPAMGSHSLVSNDIVERDGWILKRDDLVRDQLVRDEPTQNL